MAKTVANLNIQIGATTATLRRDLDRASASVRGFGRNAQGAGANVRTFQTSVSSAIGVLTKFATVAAVVAAIKFGGTLAAEAETAEIAFTTMLNSADQAKKTLGEIRDFAASTPFQTADLITASRSLIAFGESADTVVDTLRRIGDVSAGVSAPIGEIAVLYGKARVQGRLFAEDINQLTGRGIPIIQELAKQFGVTDSEVKKLVESGKVNFQNLEQAFISLTSEGGKFFGLTEAQSKSLAGVISTLKDNVSLLILEVGIKALPALKSMAATALEVTEAIRNLDAGTVQTIATIGAFALGFGTMLVVIPRVVSAIQSTVAALRALTIAATLAQSATGVGLVKALAGLAVGTAAAYGVSQAFDSMTASANEAAVAVAGVVDQFDKAASKVATDIATFQEGLKKADALDTEAGAEGIADLKRAIEERAKAIASVESAFTSGAVRDIDTINAKIREINAAYVESRQAIVNATKIAIDQERLLAREAEAGKKAVEEAQAAAEKWAAIGERLTESVQTPAEQLKEKLLEIREALNRSVIDWETYNRAVGAAVEEFDSLNRAKEKIGRAPNVGAATRGTAGGFSAVQEGLNVGRQLAESERKRAASDKERNDLLEEIKAAMDELLDKEPIKVKEHEIT